MNRLMLEDEKQDLKIYMEELANQGKVKREAIDDYLKNDLIVPQCEECHNDIKEWMGDDKAISLGNNEYICTTCEVSKTRKTFKQADREYADSLPPEERKRIEKTLSEDKEVQSEAGQKAKEIIETPEITQTLKEISEAIKLQGQVNAEILRLIQPKVEIKQDIKFTRKEINGSKTIQSDDA